MFDNVGPWTCTRVSCYAPRVHGFWMITVHGFRLGVITFLELAHMLDATQQCRPLNLHAQYVSFFCAKALLAPPSHARGWMFRWSVWSEVRGPTSRWSAVQGTRSYIQWVRSTRCEFLHPGGPEYKVRGPQYEVRGPRCGVRGPGYAVRGCTEPTLPFSSSISRLHPVVIWAQDERQPQYCLIDGTVHFANVFTAAFGGRTPNWMYRALVTDTTLHHFR